MEYCQVAYDFRGEEPGDLSLKKGEIVTLWEKNGDWWNGCLGDGRSGCFPSDRVVIWKVSFFFFF